MSSQNQEQRITWGRALAPGLSPWPNIQRLIESVGIDHDPAILVATLANQEQTQHNAALASVFTLIEQSIVHCANQTDADNSEWQTKVTELQVRNDSLTDALTNALAHPVSSRRSERRISEDPDKFGGTEKDVTKRQQQYVTWRSQIQRCFGMDEHIFNTEYRRIQHIAGLLKDDAYDMLREHFETITQNPTDPARWHWQTYQDVFKTLNDQYETLDLSRQAGIDFDNLWMAKRPFQNFIADFNKLATKSGKTMPQKVEALKVKVSQELADACTNRSDKPGPDDFEGWCKLFQRIYHDLQEKAHLDKLRNNRLSTRRAPNHIPVSFTNPEAGDPMILDARRGLRPSREQCIQQSLCFYCKQPGHNRDNCAEKKKNDIKFGRLNRSQPQTAASNQAGRGITQLETQPYMPRPQYPMAQFPQYSLSQQPQIFLPNAYNRLRATESGFVEGEVMSTTAPSPSPSILTPQSTTTLPIGTSNINQSENGSPLA
jgi:hypothetical protein